ncbi:MAG: chemotaxis protein CheW [Candidatus Marinimicrobia bacterium]|nr:chemotaxis protein CheW [Candidatus Neomarinimicrobiota bacterium]
MTKPTKTDTTESLPKVQDTPTSDRDSEEPKKTEILKSRARQLAQEPKTTDKDEALFQVLEFTLAEEHYGIELQYIIEVYPMKPFTILPGTPAFLLGIINLSGKILSVIDIRKFFELPEKGFSDLNKIILVNSGDMDLGILAESVIGDRTVSLKSLQTKLPTLNDIRINYLKGVTEDRLIILDIPKLLADKKIIIHDEI